MSLPTITRVSTTNDKVTFDGVVLGEIVEISCGWIAILDSDSETETFPNHQEALEWIIDCSGLPADSAVAIGDAFDKALEGAAA